MTRRFFDGLLLSPVFQKSYKPSPDSQRHPGVPQGTVTRLTWNTSRIYPDTTRNWATYVPAQYKADKPACVMFFCDGMNFINDTSAWHAHIVMDNLIHKGQIPVTIGVFIDPGVLPVASADQQPRYNRSYEYDAVDDRYARFLIDEILPELRKQYNISTDANDHAIAGSSSGGIAAFTAAWYRPDAFHRVFTCIGSFTDLRGGHQYPGLIRKTEHKPGSSCKTAAPIKASTPAIGTSPIRTWLPHSNTQVTKFNSSSDPKGTARAMLPPFSLTRCVGSGKIGRSR